MRGSSALKQRVSRRISATVGIAIALSALLPAFVLADDESTYYSISGRLINRQSGPVQGTVYAQIFGSQTAYTGSADANGNYSVSGIPAGTHVLVYLENLNQYFAIRSDPPNKDMYVYSNLTGQDFQVTPGVVVVLNAGSWLVSPLGVEVYSGGKKVATVDEFGNGAAVFYPDDEALPYTGTIWLARPFYEFRPQDNLRIYSQPTLFTIPS